MRYRKTPVVAAVVLMGLAGRLESGEFYVSPRGTPEDRGSQDSP